MHGLRGEVRKRKQTTDYWDYKTTKNVCLEVNGYFKRLGQNPAPRFREEINKNNQAYIRQWVMGCHFDWLNPRKNQN